MKRQSLFGEGEEEIPGIEAQTTTHTNSANLPVPDGSVSDTITGPKPTTVEMLVKPLTPPHSHYLNAAEGWLGLGDCRSALDELELIDPALRAHPDVLAVRCDIYTTAMKWPAVVAFASALVQLTPGRPSGWVRRSFALHGLKRTQQAFDLLLPAVRRFPEISTIPYNLACYCAQLGKLEEARRWLHQACEVGDAIILKTVARTDPDLSPLFVTGSEL